MDSYQAVILALIQGLTEFLPVSSSGHLLLPSQILGWSDQGLAFDVAVHLGSLGAVILYFRRDLLRLFAAWCQSFRLRRVSGEAVLAWQLVVTCLPAAVAGWLFADIIEQHMRTLLVIASTTVFFGLLLGWSDRHGVGERSLDNLSWRDVILIGCSQALALVPGTSRSGITITTALALGYSREAATRFSFLMAVPIIGMSALYKSSDLVMDDSVAWTPMAIGMVVAAASAYLCIALFLRAIQRLGMLPFVIYRLFLGLALFALALI
jgi:undecaprenyl-diphosphatase